METPWGLGGSGCSSGGEMRWGPRGGETARLSGNPRPKITRRRGKERLPLPNSPSAASSCLRPPQRGGTGGSPERRGGGGSPEGALGSCSAAGPVASACARRPGPCSFAGQHVKGSCTHPARPRVPSASSPHGQADLGAGSGSSRRVPGALALPGESRAAPEPVATARGRRVDPATLVAPMGCPPLPGGGWVPGVRPRCRTQAGSGGVK